MMICSLFELGALIFGCGVLLITCALGRRPGARRNAWAGIRLPSTMVSDEAWHAAHEMGWWHAKLMSLCLLTPAVILLYFLDSQPIITVIAESVLLFAYIIWAIVVGAAASREARLAVSGKS